ncbi:hypothetical protein QR680_004382 [Steinernema hermaphroditum]|uniref:Nuclear receptor domain-containing protein n=1 Tax=Steinernema hermaphroditum TaxID=289476 RepID=A0AA39LT39_9BILA|nr:hypothetical protein QR680_004382 [Steinernema hermaphroditum]
MMICCICSTRPVAGVNYGAASCCSCAAFFRRTVRMRIKYDCDKNELRCSAMAIHQITAIHACKKCRFDRCVKAGMSAGFVQEAQPFRRKPKVAIRASMSPSFQPASHLPLISATIEVLKQAFLNHTADRKSITVGTSEFGQNFYTYDHFRRCFLIECELFRKILNATPVIRELDSQSKDAVFRNSFLIYMPFVHTYYHIRQTHSEEKQSRYYMFDNAYMDIDPVKLQYFMALNGSSLSLASLGDYLTMARSLSAHLVTLIKEVAESAKHVLNTDEDIAALFLLVLIQSNDFGKSNSQWQEPINQLKGVSKELDVFYRATSRDPARWGNIFLLLSNLQTAFLNYRAFERMCRVYLGPTMVQKLEDEANTEELIPKLMRSCVI